MGFEDDLQDPALGVVAEDPVPGAPTLVALAGIRGGLGLPPYEFFRVTEGLRARRVFVRDLDQAWYLRGVRGLGSTLAEAAAALAGLIGEDGPLVLTGNSAGGFGAIAFAAWMGRGTVHAFSPQTAIDRHHRLAWGDLRWMPQMRSVRRIDGLGPADLDLRVLLTERPVAGPIHLHHCMRHRRDVRHARNLEGVPGVQAHRYPGGGHRLVTDLRDSGDLARILRSALDPGQDAAANASANPA
jgi:hypothetical protein